MLKDKCFVLGEQSGSGAQSTKNQVVVLPRCEQSGKFIGDTVQSVSGLVGHNVFTYICDK